MGWTDDAINYGAEALQWLRDNPEVAAAWLSAWGICAATTAATPVTGGAAAPAAVTTCGAAVGMAASATAMAVISSAADWADERLRREALERAERIGTVIAAKAVERGQISEHRANEARKTMARIRDHQDWLATPLEAGNGPTTAWRGQMQAFLPTAAGQMTARIARVARDYPDIGLYETAADLEVAGRRLARYLAQAGTPHEIIPAVAANFFARWTGLIDGLLQPGALPMMREASGLGVHRLRHGGGHDMGRGQANLERSRLNTAILSYRSRVGQHLSLYIATVIDCVGFGAYQALMSGLAPLGGAYVNPWMQDEDSRVEVFASMRLGVAEMQATYPNMKRRSFSADKNHLYDYEHTDLIYKKARYYTVGIPRTDKQRAVCGGEYALRLDLFAIAILTQQGWDFPGPNPLETFGENMRAGYGSAGKKPRDHVEDLTHMDEPDPPKDSGGGGLILGAVALTALALVKGKK